MGNMRLDLGKVIQNMEKEVFGTQLHLEEYSFILNTQDKTGVIEK